MAKVLMYGEISETKYSVDMKNLFKKINEQKNFINFLNGEEVYLSEQFPEYQDKLMKLTSAMNDARLSNDLRQFYRYEFWALKQLDYLIPLWWTMLLLWYKHLPDHLFDSTYPTSGDQSAITSKGLYDLFIRMEIDEAEQLINKMNLSSREKGLLIDAIEVKNEELFLKVLFETPSDLTDYKRRINIYANVFDMREAVLLGNKNPSSNSVYLETHKTLLDICDIVEGDSFEVKVKKMLLFCEQFLSSIGVDNIFQIENENDMDEFVEAFVLLRNFYNNSNPAYDNKRIELERLLSCMPNVHTGITLWRNVLCFVYAQMDYFFHSAIENMLTEEERKLINLVFSRISTEDFRILSHLCYTVDSGSNIVKQSDIVSNPYFQAAIRAGLIDCLGDDKYNWSKSDALLSYFIGRVFCDDKNENGIWVIIGIFPDKKIKELFPNVKNPGQHRKNRKLYGGKVPKEYKIVDDLIDKVKDKEIK